MQTSRAYSLTLGALILVACGDSGMKLTGDPIGPPGPGSGSNQTNVSSPEPTSTDGTTDGTTDGSGGEVTDSGTTTGEPADPTTGAPTTTTNVTTATTTTTTTTTTTATTTGVETTNEPPDETRGFIAPETDSDSDDSQGFIPEPTCGVDSCTNSEICVDFGDVPTCLATCDPLNLGSCKVDEICGPQGDGFVCAPDASGNTGKVGDGCAYANGCDLGNACLAGQYVAGCNGQFCCTPYCDLDLADPCIAYDMVCEGYFQQGMAPAGHEDVGVCVIP